MHLKLLEILLLASCLLTVAKCVYKTCHPDFELPKYYGDNMVFQSDTDSNLFWGFSHSVRKRKCAIRVKMACQNKTSVALRAKIATCKQRIY